MEIRVSDINFGKNKDNTMRNQITFNTNVFEFSNFEENEIVNLIGTKSISCSISYASYNTDKIAYLSYSLKEIVQGDKLTIEKIPHANVKRYSIAKMEDLRKGNVIISENIIKNISGKKKLKGVVIVNNLNGYSLRLPNNRIEYDRLNPDRVALNIKFRRLIEAELPTYISQTYLDKMEENLKTYYNSESENIVYENYYETSQAFKKVIERYNMDLLSVYPIYAFNKNYFKSIINNIKTIKDKILSFFIGQRSIDLRVIRPYPIDESENLVRLSKTAMELLGLQEADTVVIQNGEYSCKARVFLIDSWDIISNENRIKSEQDLSLLIGIPAYMRNKLGLFYINTNVSVERDLNYLFRKNLNSQVMTIISFILSLSIINKIPNLFLKILSIITFLIVMIYLSFSEVRERISNK